MEKTRWLGLLAPLLALTTLMAGGPEGQAASKAPGLYVVGIEDRLAVVVWGEANLSRTVLVRPDGKISLPLVDEIAVAGLTPSQVRDEITQRLGRILRDPRVTVIVEAINSYRVYFLGEVNGQGALQFYRPTRLLQGIAAAGGLTEFAKKEVIVIREQQGVEKRIRIDYKRLLAGERGHENIYLMPGDTVVVN